MTLVMWFKIGCLFCVIDIFIDCIIFKKKMTKDTKNFIMEHPIIYLIATCCVIMCWPIILWKTINRILEELKK